jgi:hypothetical protein
MTRPSATVAFVLCDLNVADMRLLSSVTTIWPTL